MLKKLFRELGLSDSAHRIYLALLEDGSMSARLLAEKLGVPRPSIYDGVNLLMQKGLVTERYEEGKKIFQIDDVKNLPRLLSERIDLLKQEEASLTSLLPSLAAKQNLVEPKIRFYSGAEGVRQVLNDMLWYEDIETLSMWPISEMLELLGKEYFEKLNRKRIAQHISIRAVWPENKKVDVSTYPFLGTGNDHLRDLRFGPKELSADMGYWIYADKVAFVSSRKESFGFVVHSKDFADMMRSQFEIVWQSSRAIRNSKI